MAHTNSKRKKWGLILLLWPFFGLIFSLILYAVVNWVLGYTGNSGSAITVIVNVILYLVGAASVLLGLPSVVTGIVLLATSGSVEVPVAAPVHAAPAEQKSGLSIAAMVLGISSLVLWFVGFILAVLAIIFGAIGLKRKRGRGFAITGLVTGIIGLIVSIGILISVTIVSYNGISTRATDTSVQAQASSVAKEAEYYWAENGVYPDFQQMKQTMSLEGVTVEAQGQGSGGDIIYIPCYGDGGVIWYWSQADEEYKELDVGDTEYCEWN